VLDIVEIAEIALLYCRLFAEIAVISVPRRLSASYRLTSSRASTAPLTRRSRYLSTRHAERVALLPQSAVIVNIAFLLSPYRATY
jgi:hypothetical protein